jgi:hypothetical protein
MGLAYQIVFNAFAQAAAMSQGRICREMNSYTQKDAKINANRKSLASLRKAKAVLW